MFVRRQTDFHFEATTCLTLPFHRFQQFAGLIYRYDEDNQYLLKMSYDEALQKQVLAIMAFRDGQYSAPLAGKEIPIEGDSVWLRVTADRAKAGFAYALDGKTYIDIDYEIDALILSDDHCLGFTGAYVGMAAYDLYDHTSYADFTYFRYLAL
jgi:xylan 1,4-beta-xylosidase